MDSVKKLEVLIQDWLKPLPHLPGDAQKWLANNVWWLVLVAAFGSAIAALMTMNGIFAYMNFIDNAPSYIGFYVVSSYATGWIWNAVIGLLFLVAATALFWKAVTPLKEHRRLGWDLMFLVTLLGTVRAFIDAIFAFSFTGFLFGALFGFLGLASGAYLLLEIRSYFVKSAKIAHAKK